MFDHLSLSRRFSYILEVVFVIFRDWIINYRLILSELQIRFYVGNQVRSSITIIITS